MADVLAPLLKKLLMYIDSYDWWSRNQLLHVAAHGREAKVAESFDALMDHLRKMMLGYENEEMKGLFEGIKHEVDRVSDVHYHTQSVSDTIIENCEKLCNIRYGSHIEEEEIVGFDDEVATFLDQLTGCTKQFQIVSITGMAGLGKTTLAKRLYRDPLIEYVFDIRAWTCVSQVYVKRDLLLGILSSFSNDHTEEICRMSDEQLGEKLYRRLKDHKYLVVLDDIWDCMAWNDIKVYFPDDKVGSRVIFTCRDIDLSLHVRAARPAHMLRLRTNGESWTIFQTKLFRTGICPRMLQQYGRVITRKCKGLPLAIVITAGLLKNERSCARWSQIAGSLHSLIIGDPSQYMVFSLKTVFSLFRIIT